MEQSTTARPGGDTVKIGFVGVGGRGYGLLRTLLKVPGVAVIGLCDPDAANLTRAGKLLAEEGHPVPVQTGD